MTTLIVSGDSTTKIVESRVLEGITLTEQQDTITIESTSNVSVIQKDPDVINSTEVYNVVVEVPTTNTVVSCGGPGPQGPAGDEDMPYAKQTDFINDNLLYRGEAEVGSATSSPVWRIKKVILGNDGDVSETWADGNANFDNIWDNRVSLSYS